MTSFTIENRIILARFTAGCAGVVSLIMGITTLLDANSFYDVYAVEAADFLSVQQKLIGSAAICFALICLLFALFYHNLWISRSLTKEEQKP